MKEKGKVEKVVSNTLLILLMPLFLIAQRKVTKKTVISEDSVINKWVHAVVNIQGNPSYRAADEQLRGQMREGKIDWDTYRKRSDSLRGPGNFYTGTAIFLKHNNSHYLLTARHVVADPTASDTNDIFQKIILIENDSTINREDEKVYLMNLGSGLPSMRPYIFSSVSEDLAIINLDKSSMEREFKNTLINRGYVPIEIKDIDTVFDVENTDNLLAIGFPQESFIARKRVTSTTWESELISLAVVSRGTVLNKNSSSNFFEGSIFYYHGNSGGPVISKNRLVGIVSAFTLEPITTKSNVPFKHYFLYHSVFIKSSLIAPLLKNLESRK